jgi:peptidoglycan/xylan/chitin deacetylase (PgdA/CDA1 family)
MNFRSGFGPIRRFALRAFSRRLRPLGNRSPLVSFCFDDFPRTALTRGAVVLERSGVRATYYVAMGLCNKTNELGESFNVDDLHYLVERGHELATHTYSHLSCRSVSPRVFLDDVCRGRDSIRAMGFLPSGNFAYPFGEVTFAAKGIVGDEMASCRGTQKGINGRLLDLNLLRANPLYGHIDKLGKVMELLQENQVQNGWLIFYTHDVCEKPSRYGCSVNLLDAAVTLSLKAGARVSTVSEVLAGLSPAGETSQTQGSCLATSRQKGFQRVGIQV